MKICFFFDTLVYRCFQILKNSTTLKCLYFASVGFHTIRRSPISFLDYFSELYDRKRFCCLFVQTKSFKVHIRSAFFESHFRSRNCIFLLLKDISESRFNARRGVSIVPRLTAEVFISSKKKIRFLSE